MDESVSTPAGPEPGHEPVLELTHGPSHTGRIILREIVETVALFAIVFTVARFAIGNYSIVGQSMEPNYHQDQRLLVDKISPRVLGYNRGDIVIVHSPNQPIELIKRLIGKPGDTIELRDNRVVVNGQALYEPYLPPGASSGAQRDQLQWTLGNDEYFIMGDNRTHSQDSRSFGPVRSEDIVGRALLLYWPFSDLHVVEHHVYGQ
jgi:signal peptidase I